jgi:hypothetical protein
MRQLHRRAFALPGDQQDTGAIERSLPACGQPRRLLDLGKRRAAGGQQLVGPGARRCGSRADAAGGASCAISVAAESFERAFRLALDDAGEAT